MSHEQKPRITILIYTSVSWAHDIIIPGKILHFFQGTPKSMSYHEWNHCGLLHVWIQVFFVWACLSESCNLSECIGTWSEHAPAGFCPSKICCVHTRILCSWSSCAEVGSPSVSVAWLVEQCDVTTNILGSIPRKSTFKVNTLCTVVYL